MKFPIANVSVEIWNKNEEYFIYILEDEYIYTTDNHLYQKFFLNNLYVDSKGDIYKLIDRTLPSIVRRVFSFIPNFCKVKFEFKRTERKMTIEQVRNHILNQLNQLENNESKFEWINKVNQAKSFEEIIII